jgi:hypothetical protein
VSEGFRCPECFQKEARKQEQQGKGGGPDQYTGTWGGWPVTEEMLDGVPAATLFGIPRTGELMGGRGVVSWWGKHTQLSWIRQVSRRYTEDLYAAFHRQCAQYRRQQKHLLSTQCVRLFGDATEVSGELGGRLQRRRGHDWLREQAASDGRLHVNRSGSKWTTQARMQWW